MAAKAGKKYGPTHRENAGVPPVEAESLMLVVMRFGHPPSARSPCPRGGKARTQSAYRVNCAHFSAPDGAAADGKGFQGSAGKGSCW